MIMTEDELYMHRDEYNGYCRTCDRVTVFGGVEGDAERYECDECGRKTVYGIELAMVYNFIYIND